jgi:hypothetical protein
VGQHLRQQIAESVPVQKTSEGQQSGSTADFLVSETDLDGFLRGFEFNEFGHCLVTGCSGVIGYLDTHPYVTSKQWPLWLVNCYG